MENKNNNVFKHLLIAGTAASIADAVTFPFDTAKVCPKNLTEFKNEHYF